MVRAFINLFLLLMPPLGALSATVLTLFYLKDYELGKAVKLGIVDGLLLSIALSLLLALLILVKRSFQIYRYRQLHTREQGDTSYLEEEMYENDAPQVANSTATNLSSSKETERHFVLLMDYDVAFEVALYAIESQRIGIIQKASKKRGEIVIQQRGNYIPIKLSRLSRHSSEIAIGRMDNITAFIQAIKEKEFAFLKYE